MSHDIREFDEGYITGTPSSGLDAPRRLERMRCVISTVSPDGSVKAWPHREGEYLLAYRELLNGSVWFAPGAIEGWELLEREEP